MRHVVIAMAVLAVLAGESVTAQKKAYRGVNDTYPAPQFTSRAAWNIRAAHIKELVLASAGLLPMAQPLPAPRRHSPLSATGGVSFVAPHRV